MAARIPTEYLHELVSKTNIVDVIKSRLTLKRRGGNYFGKCPFHNDATPSFCVSESRQTYHCFGCGTHGNVIGFVMEYDRLPFRQAVQELSDHVGMRIPESVRPAVDRAAAQKTAALLATLEKTAGFFQTCLESSKGREVMDYVKARGLDAETLARWGVGYAPYDDAAPGQWPTNLPVGVDSTCLSNAGLMLTELRTTGFFRNRLMFPIRNRRGEVIGFGGRALGNATPKYINSPETPVFRKNQELYGLYEALLHDRQPARILICEGFMDVVTLNKHGIRNAVATLGTATSNDHIALLFKHTAELVFCFDGDNAGQSAAWKALEACLPFLRDHRTIRFMTLPESHDPDSFVHAFGPEEFLRRMETATPFSDFFFERLGAGVALNSLEGLSALEAKAKPLIQKMPDTTLKELLWDRLYKRIGIRKPPLPTLERADAPPTKRMPVRSRPSLVRTILALLVRHPGLAEKLGADQRQRLTGHAELGPPVTRLLAAMAAHPGVSEGVLFECLRDDEGQLPGGEFSAEEALADGEAAEREFVEAVGRLCTPPNHAGRLAELMALAGSGAVTVEQRAELMALLRAGVPPGRRPPREEEPGAGRCFSMLWCRNTAKQLPNRA